MPEPDSSGGANFSFKLPVESGEATEYESQLLPVIMEGRQYFLSDTRRSAAGQNIVMISSDDAAFADEFTESMLRLVTLFTDQGLDGVVEQVDASTPRRSETRYRLASRHCSTGWQACRRNCWPGTVSICRKVFASVSAKTPVYFGFTRLITCVLCMFHGSASRFWCWIAAYPVMVKN